MTSAPTITSARATSESSFFDVRSPDFERRYTAEELLFLQDENDFELVDGRLVQRNSGAESSWIAVSLMGHLSNFLRQHPQGHLFDPQCGYHCFPDDPNKVRRADVSFIRFGRLPGEVVPKGHINIAPDLAVEVLSPNDLASEVDIKVQEYLRSGVRLVWVVHPDSQSVLIYRVNGSIAGVSGTDELSGEDVLPGFHCRMSDIFRQPVSETNAT